QVPVDRVRGFGQSVGVEHVGLVVEDAGVVVLGVGLGRVGAHDQSPGSHAEAVGGRCGLLLLGWFEGLPSRLAFECLAGCAVDVVAGAGGVVADLLGDELLAGDGLSVAFVGVVVGVAFGDELVAFGEAFEGTFGGGSVEDEV